MGITQEELAKKLGYNWKTTVCAWENDYVALRADDIIKLSTLFGVTTDYLLGLSSDSKTLECRNCTYKRKYVAIINDINRD